MPVLLAEGLIVFNCSTARYTLANGKDLPLVRGFHGGVAAYLRSTVTKSTSVFCEQLPVLKHSISFPHSVVHTNITGPILEA